MRRHAVVRQAVPRRKDQDLAVGTEESQTILKPLQPLTVARYVQNIRPAGGTRQLGQHEGVSPFGQAGDGPSNGLARDCGERAGERQSH